MRKIAKGHIPFSQFYFLGAVLQKSWLRSMSGRLDEQATNCFQDVEDKYAPEPLGKNCDLIITSDSVIAHLAGALGCCTWVILKKVPDWRWMLDRNDSPWYPKMKLFRQKKRNDWGEVFEIIKKDLLSLIKSKEN